MKNDLSHYGWIVITIVLMSIMLLFSSPFFQWVETETNNQVVAIVDMAMAEETPDEAVVLSEVEGEIS